MERDAWNKQNRQKRFQGMGFPVKKPNDYACIVLKSLFCTSGWYLFLSVQLSVQNFPSESCIAPTADLSAPTLVCLQQIHTPFDAPALDAPPTRCYASNSTWRRQVLDL